MQRVSQLIRLGADRSWLSFINPADKLGELDIG